MKKAIRRNFLLLSKQYLIYILFLVIFFLRIIIKYDTFLIAIPIITFISILSIEEIDKNKYNIIFSMPITRTEFAKAKYITLLIIYGGTTMIMIGIYAIAIFVNKAEFMYLSQFTLEMSLSFMLSMILGGLGIVVSNKLSTFYIIIMLILFENLDIPYYVADNKILAALISIILLVIGRFTFVITKENILRIYTEMEL